MEPNREAQKKYGSRAITLAIVIGFICILADQKPIGKGFILGSLFSVINFVLMGEAIPMQLGKSRSKTFIISFFFIFFRYLLLAFPIVLGIKLEQFNLVSVIIGIFMIQFLILTENILASMRGKQF